MSRPCTGVPFSTPPWTRSRSTDRLHDHGGTASGHASCVPVGGVTHPLRCDHGVDRTIPVFHEKADGCPRCSVCRRTQPAELRAPRPTCRPHVADSTEEPRGGILDRAGGAETGADTCESARTIPLARPDVRRRDVRRRDVRRRDARGHVDVSASERLVERGDRDWPKSLGSDRRQRPRFEKADRPPPSRIRPRRACPPPDTPASQVAGAAALPPPLRSTSTTGRRLAAVSHPFDTFRPPRSAGDRVRP